MKMTRFTLIIALLFIIAGCTTLYQGVVTTTMVVDTTMKMWADLSVQGKTGAVIDKKVTEAHNKYRESCGIAKNALIAYKASGDPAPYQVAVAAARLAAQQLLDLIAPLLIPRDAVTLQKKLDNAKTI